MGVFRGEVRLVRVAEVLREAREVRILYNPVTRTNVGTWLPHCVDEQETTRQLNATKRLTEIECVVPTFSYSFNYKGPKETTVCGIMAQYVKS